VRHRRLGTAATSFLLAASLAGCALVDAATGSDRDPSPQTQVEATGPTTDDPATPTPGESPSEPPSGPAPSPTPSAPPEPTAQVRAPVGALSFLPAPDAVTLALAASRAYWASAPYVIVSRTGDADALAAAEAAGVPLLVTGDPVPDGEQGADDGADATVPPVGPEVLSAVHGELARLGTVAVTSFDPAFEVPEGVELVPDGESVAGAAPARPLTGVALVTDTSRASRAAAHTARAAGAQVFSARRGDPRAARALVAAYAEGAAFTNVTALGDAFGDAGTLTERMRVVRTGEALPTGSQLVFDGTRYVALYGSPLTPALGVLGEQSVKRSVTRARRLAKTYAKLVDEDVVPMFEIIATVASAGAGKDGNYSNELDADEIWPYVEAAREAGVYVLLDLQPGRTSFLTQAKAYEDLLREPHVGLALDPEWRLKKHQVHLRQIGSVGITEVNKVADWLADLVATHDLPQKMFVLHQFTSSMIRDRDRLDTTHTELATVIHVDGQGSQGAKHGTWSHLHKNAPKGVHWGWKNFYDEDKPMATPKQTVAVDPTPDLVTYQ